MRVLEERKVMRIGADSMLPIDVRVITATNIDLKEQIAKGLFRMDLFYRINVLNLTIPPLRERKEDIALLAAFFMKEISHKYNRTLPHLSREVLALLRAHAWPGNIRELKNVIERIVISTHNGQVTVEMVKEMVGDLQIDSGKPKNGIALVGTLGEIKKRVVQKVLEEECFNKSQAAKRLGVDRGTIERLL